jgi:hypothetical protein
MPGMTRIYFESGQDPGIFNLRSSLIKMNILTLKKKRYD